LQKSDVLSHEHALNACYWRSANWASIGYRRNGIRTNGTESRMPTWYQRCPVASNTSHMSLDTATAVTVEVAMAGGVELTTGSWLLASASLHFPALRFGLSFCSYWKFLVRHFLVLQIQRLARLGCGFTGPCIAGSVATLVPSSALICSRFCRICVANAVSNV